MRIQALWRYPVKSLLGEQRQSLAIDERGVVGDRQYAIIDETGKFGSGKNTRRFTRIDNLLSLRAVTKGDAPTVEFPDGRAIDVAADDIDHRLSECLGQPVKIRRETEQSHFDDSPVHLLLSSDLEKLQKSLPGSKIDVRRFRANVILEDIGHLSASDLVGSVLTIGDTRLLITHKTERCRMVTAEQEDLEFDPRILKSIARDFEVDFGVYARVLKAGTIAVGQDVEIGSERVLRANNQDLGI
ncbi:MOSC domain-containing protein [Roseibium porphyridii]|uniref:MOSC domain-containing protein n=1 Tax=Roseibium porphyridii TaxID=2866279 RepID=A0ABY8F121_9HYPH|nr:MOSC domain-containing protein [Roseibium sp. KMA01]WFE89167.1 MOSC domain-containing protein [Roseibium sp. KMA01]